MEDILTFILAIVLLVVFSLIDGLLVMWLWNWLAVALFSAPTINFWMGWGISFALSLIGNKFRIITTVKK